MKIYPAEKEIKIEFQAFPTYSKSFLEGNKLIISKHLRSKIEYTNGAMLSIIDNILTLPNGEKFDGKLSDDKCQLKRGKYTWPNNQQYIGAFDDQNRFFTKDEESAKLIFSNGDVFEGEFKEGEIGEGTFQTEGKKISADFTGGKINGAIDLNDQIKGINFKGFFVNGKKNGNCETEIKIKNKIFSIKGTYKNGLKNGNFIIREISPKIDNLYIKGKYKYGERNGFFEIIDKEKGININHEYISILQDKLIRKYNEKYNENVNGKEVSISITYRNNPMAQLKDLLNIRFSCLLTLDLSRNNIDSISFLDNGENSLFSLQNLILSYNNISDLKPLINVDYKKLKILKVNDNKIKDISCVKEFDFKELEELNLSSNPINSLEGIENWNFPNLFILSLYRTNISDITPLGKADFPNLTQLDIYFTKISKDKIKIFSEKYLKNVKNIVYESHL